MPLYLISFAVGIVLLAALAAIQATMRGQAHHAMYGHDDVKPMDVRYTNDFLGNSGIWDLHKRGATSMVPKIRSHKSWRGTD